MTKPILFILCITIPLVIGGLSGMSTAKAIPTWYAGLNKPSFNPPNWIFGPVWTTLYLLMGVSVYLILVTPACRLRDIAITLFAVQLLLNAAWSFLFFSMHKPFLALIDILLLWISIAAMIWQFYPLSSIAAWINIPYLLWVSFATCLNLAYWRLNRG